MKTVVINTGSSSVKYQLLDMPEGKLLCGGLVERIGESMAGIKHSYLSDGEMKEHREELKIVDHESALKAVVRLITDENMGAIRDKSEISLVGHRVVHGGDKFTATTIIDQEVKDKIKELSGLAPLHNPANLVGIESAERVFADADHVRALRADPPGRGRGQQKPAGQAMHGGSVQFSAGGQRN